MHILTRVIESYVKMVYVKRPMNYHYCNKLGCNKGSYYRTSCFRPIRLFKIRVLRICEADKNHLLSLASISTRITTK
jgi:hypothetical protein